MSILPRSTWTSTPFGFARFPGRKLKASAIRALIVHWPGSAGEKPNPSPSLEASCARLRGYRNYHVRSRGWADIGYPYAIDQAGRIFEAAGSTHAAAHSATPTYKRANHENLAVLLMLAPGEEPTPAMVAAIVELRADLRKHFQNMTGLMGHQQVRGAATTCPGPAAMALIRSGALDRASGVSASPDTDTPDTDEDDDMIEYLFKSTDSQGRAHHYGTVGPAAYVWVEDEDAYIRGREARGRKVKWWENVANDRTVGRPREAFGEYIGPEDVRPRHG